MLEDFTAQVVTTYCLCDDFLKAVGHRDDPQTQMNTAEVMTVALVAAARFASNQESSRLFLKDHGYITAMLSKSRFNRRLHAVPDQPPPARRARGRLAGDALASQSSRLAHPPATDGGATDGGATDGGAGRN